MIPVLCGACGSKLNAKDELAGQTRKCPKCGKPVLIRPAEPAEEPPADETVELDNPVADQHVHGASDTKLSAIEVPKRLDRSSHYLICDRSRVLAAWKSDGNGWLLHTNSGPLPASRNHDLLPTQGDFKLIQLKLGTSDAGHCLRGLVTYQLAQRWAMPKLERGDHQILAAVTGAGSLTRQQKDIVRQAIKDRFMYEVWKDADEVLEFLGNTDFHSPGTA
ncbi:MAG: hypothetical protein HQ567_09320 [Candidatus Nealsonbacteria bacterium]|nr:hypothetical protein [Candidatus Nealsonbacteria bacterium]